MKQFNNGYNDTKDEVRRKKKAKPESRKIYVDGETLEPIIKKKKNAVNQNIERRKVIHLHPEEHDLNDPDYRVIATNDVDDEFKMKDFDEEVCQHYICVPSEKKD